MRNQLTTRSPGRLATILFLVAALLFAQGVRLCMHIHHEPVSTADHHHVSTVHLESTLGAVADHGESASDVDVPFAALLKAFCSVLALALVSMLVFLAPVPRQLARRSPPAGFRFTPSAAYNFTPPSRAPPR
jgi:hypothetical protein